MPSYTITRDAQIHLNEILSGAVEYSGFELSAIRLAEAFFEKFELIAFMPNLGKMREDNTRETFCRSYRIVYDIIDDEIYILAVIHSRRLYPRP